MQFPDSDSDTQVNVLRPLAESGHKLTIRRANLGKEQ